MAVSPSNVSSSFEFLKEHEEQLVLLGAQAEKLFPIDPVACIVKVRLFAELLAQETAARTSIYGSHDEQQIDLLRRLRDRGVITGQVDQSFHSIRRAGNDAVHRNEGTHAIALHTLKLAHALAVWFHRTFGRGTRNFTSSFVAPITPADASESLRSEIAELRNALGAAKEEAGAARRAAEDAERARMSAEDRARADAADRAAAEALMAEASARETAMVERLSAIQAKAAATPSAQLQETIEAASVASAHLDLDEASTRRLIDEQLRAAGWEADTSAIRWSEGVRPQKGRNLAIAEVPTDAGPADYVLFCGLVPIGVVEAKREKKDVAGSIQQSKRYARALTVVGPTPGGPWIDEGKKTFAVPFLFATNGRGYLKQIETKSGIWFLDARRPQNHARALVDWYTPEGLLALLKQDIDAAQAKLAEEPFPDMGLRPYQMKAIEAVEAAIGEGKRMALLAMATGTGKTKTCIALCYRLLKTNRFRRILFLVDRSALGIQSLNAFKDARPEQQQTFDAIFGTMGLTDIAPEASTRLQIATIQSMVRRVLYPDDDAGYLPPVDAYDCIVVDECHRGYLLDREMSEGELAFRSEDDYFSTYRRVLDHFDAVKIGLTATPALHTSEIFGVPVYTYAYPEAVVDGFLVDHEPPTRITTALAKDGITFMAREEVEVYRPTIAGTQLMLLPDELHIEVEQFNKSVLTESFNRVVCETLAKHIDPSVGGKTLIFCATDAHADTVVRLLKQAFADAYGEVRDDAVIKITGTADKPLQLIRTFKNEKMPSVAVTVDLLTTGIDVPQITNLVFLRRVRSRILYDQMLGRATRLCEDVGDGTAKEVFQIYDAVDLYAALEPYSAMKPVAVPVSIPFAQLVRELLTLDDAAHRAEVLKQLIVKMDRKRRHMRGPNLRLFEHEAGMALEDFLALLRSGDADAARTWLGAHPDVGTILDRPAGDGDGVQYISKHEDHLVEESRGYGEGRTRPDAYLEAFAKFLKDNVNQIPALMVVTQRPRELTREQLKSLELALVKAGYGEAQLRAAWRERTNQDIAASIIGHVRQAALGDPLVPYEERVARAMKKIMASKPWTEPQRKWLEKIAKQMRIEVVVDRDALDRGMFATQGGYARMNKVFEGQLESVLGDLAEQLWLSL